MIQFARKLRGILEKAGRLDARTGEAMLAKFRTLFATGHELLRLERKR